MTHGRSVSGRLRALERRARERGPCGVCGGEGAPGLVFQFEGEEPLRQPEPCPGCGKVGATRFTLVRRWTRPPAPAHSDTLS